MELLLLENALKIKLKKTNYFKPQIKKILITNLVFILKGKDTISKLLLSVLSKQTGKQDI